VSALNNVQITEYKSGRRGNHGVTENMSIFETRIIKGERKRSLTGI